MHMADALISPVVGGAMWAATAGAAAYSVKKVQADLDEKKIPLMGVMGAFVFATQMINFTIPATGSSGHIGGGLLLAIILGPYAGFLTMASILAIQALFFADGGLLALGSNIFNLGFYTCFVAYPLVYRWITSKGYSQGRLLWGSILAAVIGLQIGSFSVVLQTIISGKIELPFGTFAMLMQPIHLAIGLVEGLITATVVGFIWKARPEIVERAASGKPLGSVSLRKVVAGLAVAAIMFGGIFSWFASRHPDGLEWSMLNASGKEELNASGGIYETLASVQEKIAFLPDYGFKNQEQKVIEETKETGGFWAGIDLGTSASGLIGGLMTLLLAGITGLVIYFVKKGKRQDII